MGSQRTPWLTIALLYLCGLIAGSQFAKISLTLNALEAVFPGWPVAILVSGVAVMGALFGVVSGGITAKLGARQAIIVALLLSAATATVQGFLPSFQFFMALRVVEGAGHLMLVVAVPTLMAGLASDQDRGLVMGIWATFFGVSFALTAQIAPLAAISTLYSGFGFLILVLVTALWYVLPRDLQPSRSSIPGLLDHITIYRTPRLFAPGLGHGCYAFLFLALITFLPRTFEAAWLSTVLPLVGLVGSILAGAVVRWVAPGRIVWGMFLAFAFFLALAFAFDSAVLVVVAIFLSGLIAGAGFAAVPWLNKNMADRALANGALAQLGNVGSLMGTPIFASLASGHVLPVAIGFCIFAALATRLAYRSARS